MTIEKALEVIELYRMYFRARGYPEINWPHDLCMSGDDKEKKILSHCYSMLEKTERFLADGGQEQKEKALIRLGFIQCAFWATGHYSIDALSNHNHSNLKGIVIRGANRRLEPLTKEELEDWEY